MSEESKRFLFAMFRFFYFEKEYFVKSNIEWVVQSIKRPVQYDCKNNRVAIDLKAALEVLLRKKKILDYEHWIIFSGSLFFRVDDCIQISR